MRVRVPRPRRTFLEMDELVALIEAADAQDHPPDVAVPLTGNRTRDRVARLTAAGARPGDIASELGLAKSTVAFHLRNLGAGNPRPYGGRCAIVETLGRSGVRASELCDLRLGDVRLGDGRFVIRDSKTEAGVREVQMTPDLVDAFHQHLARLRAAGYATDGSAYAFPNSRGNRSTRQRIGAVVREAAAAATERLEGQGLPPLPETTPHTLRRTYISIALVANSFDVKWVMAQVGHADSKMTMDVYAQLEQRAERSHGTQFDALLRGAKQRLEGVDWATIGPRDGVRTMDRLPETKRKRRKKRRFAGTSPMARPGLEPGTPRFSVVCSTN